jgi:hypothetical protein
MNFFHFLICCLVLVIDVNSFCFPVVKSHVKHTEIGGARKHAEINAASKSRSDRALNKKVMSPFLSTKTVDSRTEKTSSPVSLHPKQLRDLNNKPSSVRNKRTKNSETTSARASATENKRVSNPTTIKRDYEHSSPSRAINEKKTILKKLLKMEPSELSTDDESTSVKANEKSKFSSFANTERIQKVIARCGVASRRDAEKMVFSSLVFLFFFPFLL